MNRLIHRFVSATWRWAALCSLALVPPATAAPPPLITTSTGRLSAITETYVTEIPNGSAPHIELVAVGHTRSGRIEVARARLPASIRRQPDPHRIERVPGAEASWEACWRIVDHGRPGGAIGCLRRRIRGNNHPDLRHPPEATLNAAWRFDLQAQSFTFEPADPLPVPRPLPLDAAWTHRAFYIPLPLQRTTPAVLKRALRARGADISPTSESATALILPDRADVCAFDRASRPSPILPALRRQVPVVYERTLEALIAPPL